MPDIEIFSTTTCPFCSLAKSFLAGEASPLMDHDLSHLSTNGLNQFIMEKTRGASRTVPAVWNDGREVEGWEELLALDRAGKLDRLLGLKE